MSALSILAVVLINAVPLIGVLRYGWSANTVVLLYWWENFLTVAFTCVRIALHRRLTRKRGHWRRGVLGLHAFDKPETQSRLVGEYAGMAIPIVVLWGMMFVTFSLVVADRYDADPRWALMPQQVLQGGAWIAAAMSLEFLLDATTLRTRSFAWIKAYAGVRLGRLLIMAQLFYAGWFVALLLRSPWGILYAMIGLKTAWDLAVRATSGADAGTAAMPFRWLLSGGGEHENESDPDEMFIAVTADEEVMPRGSA